MFERIDMFLFFSTEIIFSLNLIWWNLYLFRDKKKSIQQITVLLIRVRNESSAVFLSVDISLLTLDISYIKMHPVIFFALKSLIYRYNCHFRTYTLIHRFTRTPFFVIKCDMPRYLFCQLLFYWYVFPYCERIYFIFCRKEMKLVFRRFFNVNKSWHIE